MSAKAIREYNGRKLLTKYVAEESSPPILLDDRLVLITPKTDLDALPTEHPWLQSTSLVCKPDQLIKRRGKLGLVGLNLSWDRVKEWIHHQMGRPLTIGSASGVLDHFLVCPYVPHVQSEEYYVCIQSNRDGEEIMFKTSGGVDVGDVDATAARMQVDIDDDGLSTDRIIECGLLGDLPKERVESLASFILALFKVYRRLNFTFMEINPLVVTSDDAVGKDSTAPSIHVVDLAAKLDETASFLCGSDWGHISFPAPFGRIKCAEEKYIRELDSKTGASLKLTVLNPKARIWTMVAGGGASVVYADTICDLGFGHEMANYGEYSGAPSTQDTYDYAKTIIGLMTKEKDPRGGKILIIGGGIANFTDVAATFTGLIKALKAFREELLAHHVDIWIRRAGPNWQEGLRLMRECANETGLPIHIYGPDTEMTAIVPLALGLDSTEEHHEFDDEEYLSDKKPAAKKSDHVQQPRRGTLIPPEADHATDPSVENFSASTRCIVYGLQNRAVQGMLDFDVLCKREKQSVAAMIFPFKPNHFATFYFGKEEIMLPVYQSTSEALDKHPDVSVVINFASCRSVHSSVLELLKYSDQVKTIVIIAEGVPESQTRYLSKVARKKGVALIGPATVGGLKPGCLRIGNAGGMLDNIVDSKLYRPGSVAYVTKSGGISNELNHIISRHSDGVYEGVAIGGDRYPGSLLVEHLIRYNANPDVRIIVVLGEVGGRDEYSICKALESGKITKPLIAWCIGTCSSVFPYEVQFGHAGALASKAEETAVAKNRALREAGAHVPTNFGEIGSVLQRIYDSLVSSGELVPAPEPRVPSVPMDYAWAKRLGLVRKPAHFVTSISDERGEELLYSGTPISKIFEEDMSLGDVISLLWFRRLLPKYCSKFIEYVLMVTADHGPAVSGAHNTIIATRAGKDLVSSLTSGLLTIGPRFGGALDEAAVVFAEASDAGKTPEKFVKQMRKDNKLIMGIGHKVKSLSNPDKRVEIIKNYALEHFPDNTVLKFALEVEQITTRKKSNLILNVDGCIAVCFVDMLRGCGAFTKVEADELIRNGLLNGLFVLGRSIGFIGHHLDQKRLKQGLYRHPWDDISYLTDFGMPPRTSSGAAGRDSAPDVAEEKKEEV